MSVVLPSYNRPRMLERAIASALRQKYRRLELIVVDDGSRVDCAQVVRAFGDSRIRFHRHAANRGNAAARNTGIRLSRGQYIAFLDDDDKWHREKLARQVPVIAHSSANVGLVYCGREVVRDGEVVRVRRADREGDLFDRQLVHGLIQCSTALVKRSVLEEVGLFDENLSRGVDSDLFRRITRRYEVLAVPAPLVTYHAGHARISDLDDEDSVRAAIRGQEAKLEKFGPELEERPVQHAKILREIARRHMQLDEPERARRRLRQAVARAPGAVLLRLELVASHGGQAVYRSFRWLLAAAVWIRRCLQRLLRGGSRADGAWPPFESRPGGQG